MAKKISSRGTVIVGLIFLVMLVKYWYLFVVVGVVTLLICLIAKYFQTYNINAALINSTKISPELHLRVTCDASEDFPSTSHQNGDDTIDKAAAEKEERIPTNGLPQHENMSAPAARVAHTLVNAHLSIKRNTCGHTTNCSNYGKSCCPISIGGSCYDSLVCFSPRTSTYGSQVNGHFRRGKNGKRYWVKTHTRRS